MRWSLSFLRRLFVPHISIHAGLIAVIDIPINKDYGGWTQCECNVISEMDFTCLCLNFGAFPIFYEDKEFTYFRIRAEKRWTFCFVKFIFQFPREWTIQKKYVDQYSYPDRISSKIKWSAKKNVIRTCTNLPIVVSVPFLSPFFFSSIPLFGWLYPNIDSTWLEWFEMLHEM